jgi:hypothetical protein
VPPSSLSPPPRHVKNKRESTGNIPTQHNNNYSRINSCTAQQQSIDEYNKSDRRPLVDPTLTPRVKPRSVKTKKQPPLLRLSLDAELLQQSSSPDGVFSLYSYDNESIKTGHSSSLLSFTPTSTTQYHQQPFKSGTLGITKSNKLSFSSTEEEEETPPQLPQQLNNIPLLLANTTSSHSDFESNTRPNSQSTSSNSNISHHFGDSPVSISSAFEAATTITDDEEKLTLKERRHRRSPLSMPDTDQLTLALKGLLTVEDQQQQQERQPIEQEQNKSAAPATPIPAPPSPQQQQRKRSSSYQHHGYCDSSEEEDLVWRQQLLEQSIAFSFLQQNKSRQEAMMTLEGRKHSRAAVSLQPIVNVHDLDDHFESDATTSERDIVKDKAQYDAIVSRTHRRQSAADEYNNQRKSYRTSLRARSASDSSTNKVIVQQKELATTTLDIISENEVATTTTTPTAKILLFPPTTTTSQHHQLQVLTPETPPHHQLNAPSLISAPSTPNSIDSSVLDHDEYLNNHPDMTFVQSND